MVQGLLQGVLPQLTLPVLNLVLPELLRLITSGQGHSTKIAVELSLQKSYFVFLFTQTFLTVSLSTSITAIIQDIYHGLDSVPAQIAQNLPKASNYFSSYLILHGLSGSAAILLQALGLIRWLLVAPLADSTPTQKWERYRNLPQMQWAKLYPLYTNFACIGQFFDGRFALSADHGSGLAYSTIASIVSLFSTISFGLFWFVFRYNLLYVSGSTYDTGGRLYPTALKQLFTGLYMLEICLVGLFLAIRDTRDRFTRIGQAIGIIIAAILTAAYQMLLHKSFTPTLAYIPASTKPGNDNIENWSYPPDRRSLRHYLQALSFLGPEMMFQDLQRSLGVLAQNHSDALGKQSYQFGEENYSKSAISIPKDPLGISDDEILRAQGLIRSTNINNDLAHMDWRGHIVLSKRH